MGCVKYLYSHNERLTTHITRFAKPTIYGFHVGICQPWFQYVCIIIIILVSLRVGHLGTTVIFSQNVPTIDRCALIPSKHFFPPHMRDKQSATSIPTSLLDNWREVESWGKCRIDTGGGVLGYVWIWHWRRSVSWGYGGSSWGSEWLDCLQEKLIGLNSCIFARAIISSSCLVSGKISMRTFTMEITGHSHNMFTKHCL